MKKLIPGRLVISGIIFFNNLSVEAGQLRSTCYRADLEGQVTEGAHLNDKIEIGSVSKIFTTYWAVSTFGIQHRFETIIYAWPLKNNDSNHEWDVHFVGSRDPDFGKLSLQFIFAKLNEHGIKRIRHLSFDENFKYIDDPRSGATAESFLRTSDPQPTTVVSRLKAAVKSISSGYPQLVKTMSTRYSINLPRVSSMSVANIRVLDAKEISSASLQAATMFSYHSRPLLPILKEMNRNSNNYTANNIFEALGGKNSFRSFLQQKLDLDERDAVIFNGSGDRYDENLRLGHYNESTCETILQVIHGLRSVLKNSGLGLSLQDALAVVGKDQGATVNIYENDLTKGAVIAKTGTVNPTVALAGVANTKEGAILFASMYGPANTAALRRTGRAQIGNFLTQLVRTKGGGVPVEYSQKIVFPLDKDSDLVKFYEPAMKSSINFNHNP